MSLGVPQVVCDECGRLCEMAWLDRHKAPDGNNWFWLQPRSLSLPTGSEPGLARAIANDHAAWVPWAHQTTTVNCPHCGSDSSFHVSYDAAEIALAVLQMLDELEQR